jgi:hypothetical protein
MTRQDPRKWTFGGFERDENERFRNEDLAQAILNATDEPVHPFGAHSTPEIMRFFEHTSIQQSRKWGVCTFNEFRRYF